MAGYEIAADSADIRLDEARRGAFRGRVVNTLTTPMRTSLRLEVRGNAQWSWLTPTPTEDRDLAPGDRLDFTVAVAVPRLAAGGRYACALRAVDVRSPDERCSDELVLWFEVAAIGDAVPRTPWPVWALILLAAGLLGALAVVAMLVGRTIGPGLTLLITATLVAAIGVWERQRVVGHRRVAARVSPGGAAPGGAAGPAARTAADATPAHAERAAVSADATPRAAEPAAPPGGGTTSAAPIAAAASDGSAASAESAASAAPAAPVAARAPEPEPSDPPTMRGGA